MLEAFFPIFANGLNDVKFSPRNALMHQNPPNLD